MSNLMEVIKSRRSTRAFKSELPPKDQIMQIVEAAEWAPSGMGKYLWHFTVIYNAEKSLKLARAVAEADNRGPEYNFYGVPEDHIVVCSAAIGYIEKETPAKPRHEGLVSITE